jgi:hypothetical protein
VLVGLSDRICVFVSVMILFAKDSFVPFEYGAHTLSRTLDGVVLFRLP